MKIQAKKRLQASNITSFTYLMDGQKGIVSAPSFEEANRLARFRLARLQQQYAPNVWMSNNRSVPCKIDLAEAPKKDYLYLCRAIKDGDCSPTDPWYQFLHNLFQINTKTFQG